MSEPQAAETQPGRLPKGVFDTPVLLQAALSGRSPAWAALNALRDGEIQVYISQAMRDEYEDVLTRPALWRKNPQLAERVGAVFALLDAYAERVPDPPQHLTYERDPNDEPFINVAIEYQVDYLVSRDKDQLALNDYPPFQAMAPNTRAVDPVEFAREMERRSEPERSVDILSPEISTERSPKRDRGFGMER